MLNVNVNIVVPALPDNEVWWANSAAWTNYWSKIPLTATFPGYDNVKYNQVPYNPALQPIALDFMGQQYLIPSVAQFNSLLAAYNALNNSYIQLRTDLINAGIILNQ